MTELDDPYDRLPPPDHANRPTLHAQRLVILICAVLGVAASFLPWAHLSKLGSIYGNMILSGWLTLILFLPAIVLSLCGNKGTPLVGIARLGAAIPAGCAVLWGLRIISTWHRASDMAFATEGEWMTPFEVEWMNVGEWMDVPVHIGSGVYLLIAAGTALVILSWAVARDGEAGRIVAWLKETLSARQ